MKVNIGNMVKTEDGSIGKVVTISESGSESFPLVFEVDCGGKIHVTNHVTQIKTKKIATVISVIHNL